MHPPFVLFDLQTSLGSGFPLPPPLYAGVAQIRPPPLGAMTPIFNQGQSGAPTD